jgi:hypothetical protein
MEEADMAGIIVQAQQLTEIFDEHNPLTISA